MLLLVSAEELRESTDALEENIGFTILGTGESFEALSSVGSTSVAEAMNPPASVSKRGLRRNIT